MTRRCWTVRDLRQRLRELGCVHVRTTGSHEIWATADGATVPPIDGKRGSSVVSFPKTLARFFAERGVEL